MHSVGCSREYIESHGVLHLQQKILTLLIVLRDANEEGTHMDMKFVVHNETARAEQLKGDRALTACVSLANIAVRFP